MYYNILSFKVFYDKHFVLKYIVRCCVIIIRRGDIHDARFSRHGFLEGRNELRPYKYNKFSPPQSQSLSSGVNLPAGRQGHKGDRQGGNSALLFKVGLI